jgi:hypothetical protein
MRSFTLIPSHRSITPSLWRAIDSLVRFGKDAESTENLVQQLYLFQQGELTAYVGDKEVKLVKRSQNDRKTWKK